MDPMPFDVARFPDDTQTLYLDSLTIVVQDMGPLWHPLVNVPDWILAHLNPQKLIVRHEQGDYSADALKDVFISNEAADTISRYWSRLREVRMEGLKLVTHDPRSDPPPTLAHMGWGMFFLAYRATVDWPMAPTSIIWYLSAETILPWSNETDLQNSIVCRDVTWSSMTVLVGTKKLGEQLGRVVEGMGDVVPATFGWEVKEGARGDVSMVQAVGKNASM